jgi:hypothetical protein
MLLCNAALERELREEKSIEPEKCLTTRLSESEQIRGWRPKAICEHHSILEKRGQGQIA